MSKCPQCNSPKQAWFKLCFDCNEKAKQKLTCEKCEQIIPEGHTLCKVHWKEKQEKLNGKEDFRDKFEGKFYFNGMKVKSKSELLLLYFFEANGLHPRYEDLIMFNSHEYRPDFIVEKGDDIVIIEHFGMNGDDYNKRKQTKIAEYAKLCKDSHWFFISTDESDMYNLKETLGKKLNKTPLSKIRWK